MCFVRCLRLSLVTVVLMMLVSAMSEAKAQDTSDPPVAVAAENPSPAVAPATAPNPEAASSESKAAEPEGKKIAIPTDMQSVVELMGYWMIPYVAASVIMVWFTLERLVVLRRGRVIPKAFVKKFLEDLQGDQLDQLTGIAACEKNGSPIAKLFIFALQKWARPSVEVEQAVLDGGDRIVSRLRIHVRALNTISVIMPMVGLLGTVVGLIGAFNDIAAASAMGNIDLLAANIAIALLTTAFGLGVAIPALTIYIYLCGRVESLVAQMDELGQQVAFLVSMEGQQLSAHAAGVAPASGSATKPRAKKLVMEDATT